MKKITKTMVAGMVAALPSVVYANYYSGKSWLDVEARVSSILDNMTPSEKINFTRVDDGHMIPRLPRFGIEGTVAYDSSMGVHVNGGNFGAGYPSLTALAATWNINRAKQMGLALGYETRIAGGEQMLSPVVNIYRTPLNGRAAESICGEDPFLCSVMAPSITNGIQAQGIMAGAKHLIANEQEANRQAVNIVVDERTLREIYLPPFESLVKNADIASIMCGFNKVNGEYACENHHIITDVVKGEWGYQGFVLSDFNSIKHPFEGAWAGSDLDMPSGIQFTEANLMPLLQSGQLTWDVIDDKVKRNLRALVRYGFDEHGYDAQYLDHPEHGLTASLDVAREGIVLLKNENANGDAPLPLSKDAKIAVIGDMAEHAPSSPFGTAYSDAESDYVSELSGLRQLANNSDNVDFISAMSLNPQTAKWQLQGCNKGADCKAAIHAEYFANADLSGDAIETRNEEGINFDWVTMTNTTADGVRQIDEFTTAVDGFSARFTGAITPTITGKHVFKLRADGSVKLWLNGKLILEDAGDPVVFDVPNVRVVSVATNQLQAGKTYNVRIEYSRKGRFQSDLGGLQGIQASWAALTPPDNLADYDAVIAVVGRNYENEGEGQDPEFDIPDQQKIMLRQLTKLNPNTIVVMHAGGGMDMQPWAKNAGAIVHAWYSGQLGGQALAEILYGDVNPSGKLPISLDRQFKFNPSYDSYNDPSEYVGLEPKEELTYSEGLFVGYRGYDKSAHTPMFPFGFGLSYTEFQFSDLSLDSNRINKDGTINATFTVTNSGSRDGYETAQLYVKPLNATTERPVKELKGFAKVYLAAGESKQVTIQLDARSFAYYVQASDSWNVDQGASYRIKVGDASNHLPLRATVKAPAAIELTTRDSNPLPPAMHDAVTVSAANAY